MTDTDDSLGNDHFQKAIGARDRGDFHTAINEFDHCLCTDLPPHVAMAAWFELGGAIVARFDLMEKDEPSDAECLWMRRAGKCAHNAMEVFETNCVEILDGEDASISMYGKMYESAKQRANSAMLYGLAVTGADGSPRLRDNEALRRDALPPLRCLPEAETSDAARGPASDETDGLAAGEHAAVSDNDHYQQQISAMKDVIRGQASVDTVRFFRQECRREPESASSLTWFTRAVFECYAGGGLNHIPADRHRFVQEAREAIDKAIKLVPNDSEVLKMRTIWAHLMEEDKSKARGFAERWLAVDPTSETAKKIIAEGGANRSAWVVGCIVLAIGIVGLIVLSVLGQRAGREQAARPDFTSSNSSVPRQTNPGQSTDSATTRPLQLFWGASRGDNCTVASEKGVRDHTGPGYVFVRTEGHVLSEQGPGTIPLLLYWNAERSDNCTVASTQGMDEQVKSGYSSVRVEGYVFASQQPGTVPLKLFWHAQRGDNCTVATAKGEKDQLDSGYTFVRVEGYIFPDSGTAQAHGPPELQSPPQSLTNALQAFQFEHGWSGGAASAGNEQMVTYFPITVESLNGNQVTCSYPWKNGTLEATLINRTLAGTWKQSNGTGAFSITFDEKFSRAEGWWNDADTHERGAILWRRR